MMEYVASLFLFSLLGFSIFLVAKYYFEKPAHSDVHVWLSYKQFKMYYNLAPQKYSLRRRLVIYEDRYEFVKIAFKGIISFYRYSLFLWRREKREKAKKMNDRHAAYLECVQKDIDRMREDAQKYVDTARKKMEAMKE